MIVRSIALAALVALVASAPRALAAQHGGPAPAPLVTRAPREASQYDFLVGQWDVTVKPRATGLAQRIHGAPTLRGTWTASRALDGWGIRDELRIVDASGNPQAFTMFLRIYDATAKRWTVAAIDVYHQHITQSSAEWRGDAMVGTSEGTDAEGKAYTSRTRITGISPAGFRYRQDRSYDRGTTWEEGLLVMDVRRAAAAATTPAPRDAR